MQCEFMVAVRRAAPVSRFTKPKQTIEFEEMRRCLGLLSNRAGFKGTQMIDRATTNVEELRSRGCRSSFHHLSLSDSLIHSSQSLRFRPIFVHIFCCNAGSEKRTLNLVPPVSQ
ncbi:hypothetical protein E3N88_23110 [Mikania micrantha]|uniref:Uncharacterized protein n=1 Tax=Mikania micrantha TaxID=192012 RepID=A0A5N6NDH2_9ASTR|nr:hypothetical protein E3N88_23110 [Mikania micrantha]